MHHVMQIMSICLLSRLHVSTSVLIDDGTRHVISITLIIYQLIHGSADLWIHNCY